MRLKLYSLETTKLNDINIFFIKFIISKLEIDTEIIISSNEDFSVKIRLNPKYM